MQEGKITTNFLFASLAEFVSQFPAVWIGNSHTINRFCFGLSAGSVCVAIQSEILFEISYLIGGSISCEHQAVVVRLGNQQAQRINLCHFPHTSKLLATVNRFASFF